MSSVPRPLVAVLVVTVLVFVLWTVALKHTVTGGGSSPSGGTPAYQAAINQARGLQKVVNSAGARAGGTPTPSSGAPSDTTPAAHPATSAAPHGSTTRAPTASTTPSTGHRPSRPSSPGHAHTGPSTIASAASAPGALGFVPAAPHPHPRLTGVALVRQALDQHKVLAMLFYNPAAADDREVESELSVIPTQSGRVVKMAVPLAQLGSYASLLNQVPINFSPTLILINRDRQAEEITGFADSFEIAQRVAVALRSSLPRS